jgi:hypothetical protein
MGRYPSIQLSTTPKAVWDHPKASANVVDTIGKYLAGIDETIKTGLYDGWTAAASDITKHSNDTSRTTNSATLTKVKEMLMRADLAGVRVYGWIGGASQYQSYAKVYHNGSPIGDEYTGGTGETFTEDLTGVEAGDTIEIWARKGAAAYAIVKNMRLQYTLTETLTESTKKTDPILQDPE